MSEKNTLTTPAGASIEELLQESPATPSFLDKHQMKLIVLGIILSIAALGYVIYSGIKQSGEETAGGLLVAATDISELQSVVKNHEGTAAAFSAKILLAENQWSDGEQDDSIKTLRAFIDTDKEHPARASAQASLASKLLAQGKHEDAQVIYTELTEDSNAHYMMAYAWICLGDIALAKGDTEAAEKAYSTVEEDFPESRYAQDAISRRLLMKAEGPVEIAAPIVMPETKLIKEGKEVSPELNLLDALKPKSVNPIVPAE